MGLSPRVRGNHISVVVETNREGSIPARAGEPLVEPADHRHVGVYPRACGGTAAELLGKHLGMGLSPRVRGNQLDPIEQMIGRGSIPARAGEPSSHPRRPRTTRVYPRACGGTIAAAGGAVAGAGLSPRVRGNHDLPLFGILVAGSIPARAGEPCTCGGECLRQWVYPRACGGTCIAIAANI